MKKKLLGILLYSCIVFTALTGCADSPDKEENTGTDSQSESSQEDAADGTTEDTADHAKEIIISAGEADLSGTSYNSDGEETETNYNEESNAIVCFGQESTITYTVPEGTDGIYDIYIQLSKTPYAFASTPVNITVDGKPEVVRTNLNSCSEDFSDLFEMGTFLAKSNIPLKGGDTIELTGNAGLENERDGKMLSLMPSVGDLCLYPAGTEVPVGYGDGIVKKAEEKDESDVLSGLNICWLGSSVTFGMSGTGYSMADAIEDNHDATNSFKYAIAGTKLITDKQSSYIERMKQIDTEQDFDLFVVQFSTNDATEKSELGAVGEEKDLDSFDTMTVAGALEYIIAYAQETWNCPVIVYTNTKYDSEEYTNMMTLIPDIQEKWEVGLVDLWNNSDMNEMIENGEAEQYMIDSIHPNKDGYVEWWTPEFETCFQELLEK